MLGKPNRQSELTDLRIKLQSAKVEIDELKSERDDLARRNSLLEDESQSLKNRLQLCEKSKLQSQVSLSQVAYDLLARMITEGRLMTPGEALMLFGWAPLDIHNAFIELVKHQYIMMKSEGEVPMATTYVVTDGGVLRASQPFTRP